MRTVLLNWKCRYFNPHLPLEFHLLHASIDFLVPLPIEKSAIYSLPAASCYLPAAFCPPCRAVALAKAGASNLERSAHPTSKYDISSVEILW